MKESTSSSRDVRFGVFEVDLEAGQLLKDGQKVKLQGQPFQVLAMLLERPGQVVTREELQQRLWSADTFVDFDHGLNKAINKIREALGDSADSPRFVETLARRGYRFVAPVEQVGEHYPSNSNLGVDKVTDPSVSPASPAELQGVEKVQRRRWTAGWTWAAGLTVLILAGVGWFYFHRLVAPPMNVVRFTSYPGKEKDPALSPDGQRLAFAWDGETGDNFDVYVRSIGPAGELPLTTERPLRLTTDPATDVSPTWSPDGRYLAFARVLAGNSAVYVMPSIGGQERKLTERYTTWTEGKSLDWSPDGKSLVVTAKNSPGDPYSLYSISLETGDDQKLTSPPVEFGGDVSPVFSPDGQILAFTRVVAYDDVYLLPLTSGQPKRLTANTRSWSSTTAWTADGREIVYGSAIGGSPQLRRVSVSSAKPRTLGIGANGSDPTISRQGNRLAYLETAYDTDIWRIEVPNSQGQGSPPTTLIQSSQRDDDPQYSPDGKSIVFISDRSGSWEIWFCDSDGRNARQLTSFPGASVTASPRWSPNGRQIVFDSWEEGRSNIFVVSPEGGSPRCLTEKTADAFLPSWSRDGRWIYFCSNRSGDSQQIWRMPAEGGQAVRVTKNGGFEALPSPDGKSLYYSKLDRIDPTSGSAHLWRVPVEGGEETLVFPTAIYPRYWALTERGIYFVPSAWSPSPTIEFLSFATGKVTQIVALDKPPVRWAHPGLSISPDGRWILCALVEQDTSDIMLVENFR